MISKKIWMKKTEVTQLEYKAVMGKNPSHFEFANCPVENVSWIDSFEFCIKLSETEGLTPCYKWPNGMATWNRNASEFRLPTEAEWEYASGAGSSSRFCFGDSEPVLWDYCWFKSKHTRDVMQKNPNAWGLYDIIIHVLESCWDGDARLCKAVS